VVYQGVKDSKNIELINSFICRFWELGDNKREIVQSRDDGNAESCIRMDTTITKF
jgi:hypothetical protein